MRDQILNFLKEIDEQLADYAQPGEYLDLYLIGRSSLILRLDLALTTDDVDIVRMSTSRGDQNLEERAIELFGEGTPNALRLGLHLERVSQGLPPLPQGFKKRCTEELQEEWRVIRPKFLEFNDFAVTKLKRFSAKDRRDLKILCDKGLITAAGLEKAIDNAYVFHADEEDSHRKDAYGAFRKVCAYLETGEAAF